MSDLRVRSMRSCGSTALSPSRCGWCLPPAVKKFASRLLSQQLWCWGQDVTYKSGNLLMRYGMERHRHPGDSERGSTCYRLDDHDRHLALWGFGMFFGTRKLGGLYIARYDFVPVWGEFESLRTGIHSPSDLPAFHRPRRASHWQLAHRLLRELMRWIVGYERWVSEEVGKPYRAKCVADWLDPVVDSNQIANAWHQLSLRRWEQRDWIGIQHQLEGGVVVQ